MYVGVMQSVAVCVEEAKVVLVVVVVTLVSVVVAAVKNAHVCCNIPPYWPTKENMHFF